MIQRTRFIYLCSHTRTESQEVPEGSPQWVTRRLPAICPKCADAASAAPPEGKPTSDELIFESWRTADPPEVG
jgi:hypothetical protein